MEQTSFDFDICSNRHKGAATSIEANKKAAFGKAAARQKIMDLVTARGSITCSEAADAMGTLPNKISGRFTALLAAGKIVRTKDKRKGFSVYTR